MLVRQLKSWQTELQNLICSADTPLTSVKTAWLLWSVSPLVPDHDYKLNVELVS